MTQKVELPLLHTTMRLCVGLWLQEASLDHRAVAWQQDGPEQVTQNKYNAT